MNPTEYWNGVSAPYQIDQSLRFDGSSSFTRTNGTPDSTSVTTFSCWIKKATPVVSGNQQLLFYGTFPYQSYINFTTGGSSYSDNLSVLTYANSITGYTYTNALLRDPNAWYHIVLKKNGTTVQWYINGELQSTTQTGNNGSNTTWNGASVAASFGSGFNGYIAEAIFVDNQDLNPNNFGELDDNGVWRPISYTGTFGAQGWYLKFDPSATNGIGHDHSGNGNNFTPTGFTTSGTGTDVMSDTPTNNYATLNAISPLASGTLSNGNLNFSTGNADAIAVGTVAVSSGKWYWEITATNVNASVSAIGIIGQPPASLTVDLRTPSNGYCYISNGNKGNNNTTAAYGATYTSGDVIGVALDLDAGTLVFYKNNSSQGTAYSSLSGTFSPAISDLSGASGGAVFDCNFGQRAFAYTPPTGFKALNTANLPAPTVKDGSDYFNTVLWTGNGVSGRAITGVGFQPDFLWIKRRNATVSHYLQNSVTGATNYMFSDDSIYERNLDDSVDSFDTDGFTLGNDSGTNGSGGTYVGWNWLAGNGTSSISTGSIDSTNPTIASTVSANPTAGFSIVSYTGNATPGATVGHNLGVAPSMTILKSRDSSTNWYVWHAGLTQPDYQIYLNLTNAQDTSVLTFLNDKAPTSTVFELPGSGYGSNNSGVDYIAYCFAEVEGYSKFGSYTGNGSSDGPFVATSFAPAWILLKRTDTTGNWILLDNRRYGYNSSVSPRELYANLALQEADSNAADFLSNGFKLRVTYGSYNALNGTYIFAAFAENPFGGSGVSPATAR